MTRLIACVVLVLLCGLSACDDDPTPNIPDETPSASSPTVSESPSPTEPTETPEALTPEETVRAWVAARNEALQDGNVEAARALSALDCRSCKELLDPIEEIYAAGGSFDTTGWTVAGLSKPQGDDPIKVNAAMKFAGGTTVSEAGAEPMTYGPERHVIVFDLSGTEDGLRVSLVLFVS